MVQVADPVSRDRDILITSAEKTLMEGAPSFSLRHRAIRALFGLVWFALARWTPPPMMAHRRWILRLFGARVDRGARVYPSARIWYPPNLTLGAHAVIGPRVTLYSMAPLEIGARAVISQGAHLCCGSHDVHSESFQLIAKPITIGAGAWIAAEAFVGPGVSVGARAVLGARGVAVKDLSGATIYAGNPATPIGTRSAHKRQ